MVSTLDYGIAKCYQIDALHGSCLPTATFAYCEPGSLGIDLDTAPGSPAVVSNVTPVPLEFSGSLTDFVTHRYYGPPQEPTIRTLSIPAKTLAECKIDVEQTRRLAIKAVGSRQQKDLVRRGITLRFPMACEGDPFYLVYFMKGNDIEWIWQIQPGTGGPVWSYESKSQQRRIPDLALRNLTKPELWYAPR